MNKMLTITVLILFIAGCKKENNPVSNSNTSVKSAFVIDTLTLTARTLPDTLRLNFKVSYHLEGLTGSLNGFTLMTDSVIYAVAIDPLDLVPTNTEEAFSDELEGPKSLINRDSLFFRYTIAGSFWDQANKVTHRYGTFAKSDSQWVHVQR